MAFFLLSFLLASFLQFSQLLFNNNYLTAKPILWIGLMVALPLGAAWSYLSTSARRFSAYRWLIASVLWCLFGNLLYVVVAGPWESTRAGFLLTKMAILFGVESFLGTLFFCPVWFCFGAIEFQLYRTLETATDRHQVKCYVASLMGIAASTSVGSLLFPERSPALLLAMSVVALGLLMAVTKPESSKRGAAISFVLLLGIIGIVTTGRYVMHPSVENRAHSGSASRTLVFDEWSRYCRLSIAETQDAYLGFYDSVVHWMTPKNVSSAPFYTAVDEKVFGMFAPQSRFAILGAGGGAQLPPALKANPKSVVALDLHPSLPRVLSSLRVPGFNDPRVKWETRDARKYIEQSDEPFDLIYLPMAESFLRLASHVFEPGDHLYTLEAFENYRRKLTPDGWVAVRKLVDFDRFGPIVNNYAATMREAGFSVWVWRDRSQFVLFGTLKEKGAALLSRSFPEARPYSGEGTRVLVDDRPFFASAVFTPKVLWTLTLFVILLLGAIAWSFRKNFSRDDLAPLCCGLNYTLLLMTFQLLLFYSIANPLESPVLGSLIVVSLCGAGALLSRRGLIVASVSGAAVALHFQCPAVLVLVGLCALWSGGFFPSLLNQYRHQIPHLLVWDGLGAAVAGGLYLWIPVVLGVKCLIVVSGLVFAGTYLMLASFQTSFTNQSLGNR